MIRIATWNVDRPQKSQTRRDRLGKEIQAMEADVWILTETHSSFSLKPDFECITTEESDPLHEPGEAWVAIWSRFPIERVASTADPARSVAVRIIPDSSRPVVVYGTVLPWIGSTWRNFKSADGAAFSAALKAQCSDWVSLQSENPGCNFVLAGDLNQDLADAHYYGSQKNKEALQAALAVAGLRCLTAGDLDPVLRHAPSCASIDHICVSLGLAPLKPPVSWPMESTPQKSLSDHFGVLVELAAACGDATQPCEESGPGSGR